MKTKESQTKLSEIELKFRYPNFIKNALFSPAKFVIIVAGRRSGKTYNTCQWLCDELLIRKMRGIHVDTVQTNITKYVDRYYREILNSIWHLCSWNTQKYILTLPNGSTIDFVSAERPENAEGFEYDRGIVNEAGIILKKPSLWFNTLLPMFKGQNTKVRIIGTPKNKNTFFELFLQGSNKNNSNYKSFRFTAYDSPFWSDSEIEEIKKVTPELIFRQEILAEFLEGEGSVFRGIAKCIKPIELLQRAKGGRSYIIGIDLAKTHDFTVITIIDEVSKEVVYFNRFNQLDWNFQKTKIYEIWKLFNRSLIVIDSTGVGSPIYDDLKKQGIRIEPYQFTSSSKKVLIENLMLAIENQEIAFPDIPQLIGELESFEFQTTRMGNISYNAPEGLHDDCVISLSLACIGLKLFNNNRFNISFG